jgi:YidC/Oxa1 family membrane protein insertase
MDIQRTILWVIFGLSILFLWDNWQKSQGRPPMFGMPPAAEKKADAASPARPADAAPSVPAPGVAPKDASVPQPAAAKAAASAPATAVPSAEPVTARGERVHIETDTLRVDVDTLGAVLSRVELVRQKVTPDWTANGLVGVVTGKKQDTSAKTVLLDVNPNRTYVAQSGLIGAREASNGGAGFPTHRTEWTPLAGPRSLAAGADSLTVKFAAESGGMRAVKSYTFFRGRHDIEVSHEITNVSDAPITPSMYLQIMRDGNKPEGESALYYVFTGPAIYSEAKKFQKLDFKDIEKGKADFVKSAPDGWIAMIQHYFVSAWVPPAGVTREFYTLNPSANLFVVGSQFPLGAIAPGAGVTSSAKFFSGPQDQNALEALAPGLDLVVDYGWLTFIAKPLFWLLEFLHRFLGNWGWAIVVATCLIKAAFYPLSAASYKSMARMKEVTPRMMKIREQYGNDKQKMNVAMMELYKNEKINPLGGCLPIVVQIPVFIAYYWVILASVEMRNAPWLLWVQDLATPDPWFILPVVMIATMWIQYKLNPTPPDPVQAKVMAAMPFIFGVMFFFFPAGLVLYWLVNNVLSIAQQWYVTKQIAKKS